MTAPTLTTDRLVLRQLELDDSDALFKTLSDDHVMRYWSNGPHQTVNETRAYIVWNADAQADHLCWAITTDGAAAMGWVILIPRRKANFELGYILGRDYWRKGYLTEAANAVLNYAFGEMGARRIMADTDPDNDASIALLGKLGFRKVGHLREEWETHIGVRDSLIFGLLRHDREGRNA